MKYYCLLIQFIILKQSCQTRRCFSYLLPHFSLCRSRTQKLADSQIACQCVFCYFIFIKITVQRQKKCTTILSEYIDSLASTEGENVLIYLVLLSLEDTPPKQNLKWRINVYSQLKFSQNCQKSFWNNEGFFCLLSPCFWFLKLMVRISTQGNYSEEQLCGIEELIKFYVDFFHYEHRVLLGTIVLFEFLQLHV